MVELFLAEPRWDETGGAEAAKEIISLLNKLGSVIWCLMVCGGKSEARQWLCNAVSGLSCISPKQHSELFESLLTSKPKRRHLASQLLRLFFERRPKRAGLILAKKSHILEKFFEGNPRRIIKWFSSFGGGDGSGHRKGARALSQFSFANRDICWEELEWKGKHGQSPAVVATKPHYFLDLDVQQTVENFLQNVPEFWSSSEFAESLKDGEILSLDAEFFVEFFTDLMFKEDSLEVWEVINEFLKEESFSSLCIHLLITLEDGDLCIFLASLRKYINPRLEARCFNDSSFWLELILHSYGGLESFDLLLLLNAVINQRRNLLRLVRDEESNEENASVKDIVSRIRKALSASNSWVSLLKECSRLNLVEIIRLLGLQCWVFFYALTEEGKTTKSWESAFIRNGIRFRRSDRYSLLHHDIFLDSGSESNDRASSRPKKKRKDRKKRKGNFDHDNIFGSELIDFDAQHSWLGLESGAESWMLSTDDFSTPWTSVDLPEYLSSHCLSTWMKQILAERNKLE